MELTEADPILMPPPLRSGDKVRFVSPASPPPREWACHCARMLESWGLEVDFGEHVFGKVAWLAGTDAERLGGFQRRIARPEGARTLHGNGWKGLLRIADRLDFAAARSDPKFLVGISDITALQLSLWKHCRLVGVHGSFVPDGQDDETLRKAMMTSEGICLHSRADEPTSALTTEGTARGRLIEGSLLPMSAAAGWALPSSEGSHPACSRRAKRVQERWTAN